MKSPALPLLVICLTLAVASALAGTAPLGLSDTLGALAGQGSDAARAIVWEIRLPRALAAFGCGAALGLAGAAMQGLLQNPLAEPGVLGISAFSALGAVAAIFFGFTAAGSFGVPIAAILGAGVATAILILAAGRGTSTVTLLLIGIGLSSLAGALMALTLNLAPNPGSLADLVNWTLGSVANRGWPDIAFALPGWTLGALLILVAGSGLRALSLGDETALTLGADPRRLRLLVILGTALLAGSSIAIAGTIGFVGIVAPHIVRPWVGHDPKRLLVPAALLAGAILMTADLLIRTAPIDRELRLGVVAALIGAPVFIWIAARLGRLQP